MSKESIIKVGRFDKASDYPIGQKLIINGRTCVVTKHGDCADCFVGVPNIHRRDTDVICKDLACTSFERKDKTSVHFKEI